MDIKLNQQVGYLKHQEMLRHAEQFRQAQRRAGSVPAQEQPATPHFTPLRKAIHLVAALLH